MNTSGISDTVENLQDQAMDFRDRAVDEANRWKDCAAASAKNASMATDKFVHENVWSTVAIAAVAGCVVGFLLGQCRD